MCTPSQQRLMRAFEVLDDVCRRHRITYWLEFGSALGAVRHHNVIPWDYDGDVGLLSADYIKLVHVLTGDEQAFLEANNLRIDVEAYKEPGACCFLEIVDGDQLGIDVVAYDIRETDTGLRVETKMSESLQATYPGIYSWSADIIFPLHDVVFVGMWVHIPAKYVLYLATLYGPHFITPDCVSAKEGMNLKGSSLPHKYVTVMSSIDNGLLATDTRDEPFVVIRTRHNFLAEDAMWFLLGNEEKPVYGYDKEENVVYVDGADVQRLWFQDALPCNIVDSPVDARGQRLAKHPGLNSIGYVATNSNGKYHMHIDPVEYGGGWMVLYRGIKVWWFIRPSDMLYLATKGITIETLAHKSFTELVTLDDGYLWGKLIVAVATPGTFLYFPPGCAHTVRTHERAAGLGGYA